MNPVLQKIVDQKKVEIKNLPSYSNFTLPVYNFTASLKKTNLTIIAECKKASPSAGVIRENYNPLEIAKIYEDCGAGAISVLTDENFFCGHINHLKDVASSVEIPVLRKDFILDEKQIAEARFFGASAVLLIVRILTERKLKSLLDFTRELGMEALIEIHTEEEAQIAVQAGGSVIGINTRDLDTFKIHTDLIEKVSVRIPSHLHIVGESGIKGKEDLLKMKPYVQSVLIGSYFMEQENVREAFRSLIN